MFLFSIGKKLNRIVRKNWEFRNIYAQRYWHWLNLTYCGFHSSVKQEEKMLSVHYLSCYTPSNPPHFPCQPRNQWLYVKAGMSLLKKVLEDDFGFTRMFFVFSGRRGVQEHPSNIGHKKPIRLVCIWTHKSTIVPIAKVIKLSSKKS